MKKEIVIPMLFFIVGFAFSMWGIFKESFTIQQKIATYFVGGLTIFWGLVVHYILEREKYKPSRETQYLEIFGDWQIILQNAKAAKKGNVYQYKSKNLSFEAYSEKEFLQKIGLEILKCGLGHDLEYFNVSDEYPSWVWFYHIGEYGEVGYKDGAYYASHDGVYANHLPTMKDVEKFFFCTVENLFP